MANPAPPRILLTKIGLDGHDRGVKVLARMLRDAGMEVIYTGLWQTPQSAAKAAVEEDVDVLGASFHSAAHLTLVPVLMEELKKLGRADIPVVLGGIIPRDDVPAMEKAGVAVVLETECPADTIVRTIQSLTLQSRERRSAAARNGALEEWAAGARGGERASLGRLLTWIENDAADDEAERLIPPADSGAIVVGVTGPAGVGKSTLIGRLLAELSARGRRVAVIAVDPASPLTGGALLGDRARMTLSAGDPNVFLRSSASRGEMGGLAPRTGTMVGAVRQSRFDVLIIETVGAGQNDVALRRWARPLVLVMMPGMGDDLQLEKAGITEVADAFVINKADLPGADRLESQIRDVLGGGRPVVQTIASHGKGIAELADVILGKESRVES